MALREDEKNAVSSMSEFARALMDGFTGTGFSNDEAFSLTTEIIKINQSAAQQERMFRLQVETQTQMMRGPNIVR